MQAYYIGYGTPLTALVVLAPRYLWAASASERARTMASGALFGAAFPFCLVGAYFAAPVPSLSTSTSDRPPALPAFAPCMVICERLSKAVYRRTNGIVWK